MALRPETEEALERGRALYNQARYYEAHEAWEEAWLREQGETKRLLQGLIQVAAGYVKGLEHRSPAGAAKLLASGLDKLSALPDGIAGLLLVPFREGATRSLAEARRWAAGQAGGLDPALAPRLERAPQPPAPP